MVEFNYKDFKGNLFFGEDGALQFQQHSNFQHDEGNFVNQI